MPKHDQQFQINLSYSSITLFISKTCSAIVLLANDMAFFSSSDKEI